MVKHQTYHDLSAVLLVLADNDGTECKMAMDQSAGLPKPTIPSIYHMCIQMGISCRHRSCQCTCPERNPAHETGPSGPTSEFV